MLSRRAFVIGTSALVVAPALPTISAAPAVTATARAITPMWAVGTPGEFDWQAIRAATPEEAWRAWLSETGWPDDDRPFEKSGVQRIPQWDDLETVRPTDWIDADMGHCCSRCGYETHRDAGGRSVGDEVVCEDCFSFADLMAEGGGDAIDELANKIADEGEDEAREGLISSGNWEHVPPDLWQAAVVICRVDARDTSGAGHE
ncbi:hypothetical protein [Shinella sp.]|uniref:hypothetical protein n=1 Tax=Shinella sp. TaxID=1870904 RepID=UPI00258B4027|nr:hypothetical protein [Shinella sp.]MCW5711327.1 hypothetical protein [Shinella sp.]